MAVLKGSDNPFPSILFEEHVDPATPPSGHWRLFVDTDNVLKLIDDAGAVSAVSGTAGLTDPMTTRGDIIVRNASNVTARLAIGSTGKVLSSDGTDISWQTPAAAGMATDTLWDAAGDLAVGTGSNTGAKLTIGSSGKVLTSNGTTAAWQTPAAGGLTMPQLVQFKNSGTGNTALTLTLDAAPTSGNILVLGSFSNGSAGLSTVANTNVTWTKVATGTALSSTVLNIWVGLVSGVGGTTVTITRAGGNAVWSVCEYAGVTVTPTGGTPVTSNDLRVPAVLAATTAGHVIGFVGGGVSQNQSSQLIPSIPLSGAPASNMCVVGLGYSQGGATLGGIYSADGAGCSQLVVEIT